MKALFKKIYEFLFGKSEMPKTVAEDRPKKPRGDGDA